MFDIVGSNPITSLTQLPGFILTETWLKLRAYSMNQSLNYRPACWVVVTWDTYSPTAVKEVTSCLAERLVYHVHL